MVGNESNVSAAEVCELLKQNPYYKGGNIRLISCQTGAGSGIVPQYLADHLHVNVMAPNEIVNVDKYTGEIILANDDKDVTMGIETGKWIVFKPRKE